MTDTPTRAGESPAVHVFRLPDVGEGLEEAEIVSWRVAAGQVVAVNDVIVEIETAKSLVELPSPVAGTVGELLVEEGETVEVGSPIIRFDLPVADAVPADDGPADAGPVVDPAEVSADAVADPADAVADADDAVADAANTAADADPGRADPDRAVADADGPEVVAGPEGDGATPSAEAALDPEVPVDPEVAVDHEVEPESMAAQSTLVGWVPPAASIARRRRHLHARVPGSAAHGAGSAPQVAPRVPGSAPVGVLTSPPVRKLARDLGVDLATVRATGPRGTVSRPDVLRTADAGAEGAPGRTTDDPDGPPARPAVDLPARETRVQIRSVRRMTAENVTASAFTAPHVTEFLEVDITRSMKLLDRLRGRRDMEGLKVSPVLLLAKAMCLAAKRTPEINASWDGPNNEIVYKNYVNLGIAAATPRGLMVPNIKDAEQLAIPELCRALNELVSTARAGRTTPAQMQGGTITLTNVGVFGVDTGTPILNPGESAILAFGAINDRPWVHKGRVRSRRVTTLALGFDHRIVDGEQGSRFLADVGVIMSDPATSLLWT